MIENWPRRALIGAGASLLSTAALAPRAALAAERRKLRKVYVLVARKDGLDREQFVRHWIDIHAALASSVPGVMGFTGSELISGKGPGEPSDFDGIAIIWYGDDKPVGEVLSSPEGKAWLADGDTFISRERSASLVGHERVYFMPSQPNGTYKQLQLLTPKPGLSREAFLAELHSACLRHGAKADGLTGVALTELNPRTSPPASGRAVPYEAVLETWWSDRATAERALASSALLRAAMALADSASSHTELTVEHVALPVKA